MKPQPPPSPPLLARARFLLLSFSHTNNTSRQFSSNCAPSRRRFRALCVACAEKPKCRKAGGKKSKDANCSLLLLLCRCLCYTAPMRCAERIYSALFCRLFASSAAADGAAAAAAAAGTAGFAGCFLLTVGACATAGEAAAAAVAAAGVDAAAAAADDGSDANGFANGLAAAAAAGAALRFPLSSTVYPCSLRSAIAFSSTDKLS